MSKKSKKTSEEKQAEEYFRVEKSDIKSSVEKSVTDFHEEAKTTTEKSYKKINPKDLETVEPMPGRKKKIVKKKSTKKKSARKKTPQKYSRNIKKKQTKFTSPKIELNPTGYELIITEKPQAASKISAALGIAKSKVSHGVTTYEINRQGKKIIIACAVGHLFTLQQQSPGSQVPIFEIGWVPNYLARKSDFTKKYYDNLLSLAKKAGSITVATDYDIEGEVIGLNIVKFICGQKDAQRMKFSTLTKNELNSAYENKNKTINWGQAIAGETRHYLDWFYGINLSRALMNAIKTTGRFKIMSIGRVQGPALKLIVDKEKEIQKFKSQKYWQVFITIKDEKNILELKYIKDIFEEKELKNFDNLNGKNAQASTTKKSQTIPPNPPFNLTTLQTEAYKFHRITPSKTLRAAQSLYLSGLISYPRTSSQKLPASIEYSKILKVIAKKFKAENLIQRKNPIEGKKSDPAHPSIYPTGNFQILSGDEEKIYNLIAKRFIALFCGDAKIDNKTVKAEVNKLIFTAKGSAITSKGWMEVYPTKQQEKEIPDIEGKVKIINSKIEEKETQPPKRFSQASIISQLEKRNLGTKATRSSILETLFDRGYVKGKSVEATPLGISLIDTLEKYSPIIIDEKLTRNLEEKMQGIVNSKKDFAEKEKKVLEKAKESISEIAKQFEKNENKIGRELLQANVKHNEQQRKANRLLPCPKCRKGHLAITYSKKNRRQFVACDAYPDCQNTFSLPPNGNIEKTDKICEECGFPKLRRLTKGRRPWEFCFNPKCPTNAEWVKKREEKSEN